MEPIENPGEKNGKNPPLVPHLLTTAAVAYFLLFLSAYFWIGLQDRNLLQDAPFRPLLVLRDLGLGLGAGAAVVGMSVLLSRLTRWTRTLEIEFKKIFGDLERGEIIILALLSGFVEEMLFRGAMQPVLGLVFTSLLFGILHIGPGRIFLPWTLFAAAMGFGLGGLYELTGSLTAPVTVHVFVNFVNLSRINRVAVPEDVKTGGDSRLGGP